MQRKNSTHLSTIAYLCTPHCLPPSNNTLRKKCLFTTLLRLILCFACSFLPRAKNSKAFWVLYWWEEEDGLMCGCDVSFRSSVTKSKPKAQRGYLPNMSIFSVAVQSTESRLQVQGMTVHNKAIEITTVRLGVRIFTLRNNPTR
jgi:hypothetical protein